MDGCIVRKMGAWLSLGWVVGRVRILLVMGAAERVGGQMDEFGKLDGGFYGSQVNIELIVGDGRSIGE